MIHAYMHARQPKIQKLHTFAHMFFFEVIIMINRIKNKK